MSKITLLLSAATIAAGALSAIAPASAQIGQCRDGFWMNGQQVPVHCDGGMHGNPAVSGPSQHVSGSLRDEPLTTGSIARYDSRVPEVSQSHSMMVDGPVGCHPGGYWLRASGSGNGDVLIACPAR